MKLRGGSHQRTAWWPADSWARLIFTLEPEGKTNLTNGKNSCTGIKLPARQSDVPWPLHGLPPEAGLTLTHAAKHCTGERAKTGPWEAGGKHHRVTDTWPNTISWLAGPSNLLGHGHIFCRLRNNTGTFLVPFCLPLLRVE